MSTFPLHLGSAVDKAAQFCTYCPRLCRFACPIAEVEHRESTTPWGLMRLLEYARQGSVDFDDDVSEMFYHCTGCGRCQEICKHDIDVPRAVWKARSLGKTPAALEGFVDFFEQEKHPHRKSTILEESKVADVFDVSARDAFFPDCETRRYQPDLVFRIGEALEIILGEKVKLSTRLGKEGEEEGHGCCGFPLSAAGDVDALKNHSADLEYEHLSFDRVFTDCASFYAMSINDTFGVKNDTQVIYLPSFLAENIKSEHVLYPLSLEGSFYHDSCLATRHTEASEDIRKLLSLISDEEIGEFSSNHKQAPCCGGASHYHVIAEAASEKCASDRFEQLEREGGNKIVTSCQTCVKQFSRVDAEVENLLSLVCDALGITKVEE